MCRYVRVSEPIVIAHIWVIDAPSAEPGMRSNELRMLWDLSRTRNDRRRLDTIEVIECPTSPEFRLATRRSGGRRRRLFNTLFDYDAEPWPKRGQEK